MQLLELASKSLKRPSSCFPDLGLHVDQPIVLGGTCIWQHDSTSLPVQIINDVVLQVDSRVEQGDIIFQVRTISRVDEVHQALLDYWTPIWNAMDSVPTADWQRL